MTLRKILLAFALGALVGASAVGTASALEPDGIPFTSEIFDL